MDPRVRAFYRDPSSPAGARRDLRGQLLFNGHGQPVEVGPDGMRAINDKDDEEDEAPPRQTDPAADAADLRREHASLLARVQKLEARIEVNELALSLKVRREIEAQSGRAAVFSPKAKITEASSQQSMTASERGDGGAIDDDIAVLLRAGFAPEAAARIAFEDALARRPASGGKADMLIWFAAFLAGSGLGLVIGSFL